MKTRVDPLRGAIVELCFLVSFSQFILKGLCQFLLVKYSISGEPC